MKGAAVVAFLVVSVVEACYEERTIFTNGRDYFWVWIFVSLVGAILWIAPRFRDTRLLGTSMYSQRPHAPTHYPVVGTGSVELARGI